MAINLITWDGAEVPPMMDAIIHDVGVGESGILYGCSVNVIENTLSIDAGYGLIKGRLFQVTATEIPVTLSSGANLYGRLIVRLDLSNTSTPISLQVETGDSLYSLVQQDDANYIDGVYEISLARFTITSTALTNLVTDFNSLSYDNDVYYKPGETATLEFRCGGVLTSNKTRLVFGVNFNKSVKKVHSVSFVSGRAMARQDGKYLMGSGTSDGEPIGSAYSVALGLTDNMIKASITKSSGFGGVNNDVASIFGAITVRFS